jgi:DNA-binding CsgD family transcriptional regulator
VAELDAAVQAARRSPSRLLRARGLSALGAAHRRSGRRPAARETLREALKVALAIGADRLAKETQEELVVAGARPRRIALEGRDALTASERRVADLAADGKTNKDIAQALFLSVKTVEVHLGRSYAKLNVTGRTQLRSALGADAPTS